MTLDLPLNLPSRYGFGIQNMCGRKAA